MYDIIMSATGDTSALVGFVDHNLPVACAGGYIFVVCSLLLDAAITTN